MKKTILCAVLCAALLAGCAAPSSAPSQSAAPTPPPSPASTSAAAAVDTLSVGHNKALGFNPYIANDNQVLQNSGLVFEKLVEITPLMQLEMRLASEITVEGATAVIHLRQDAVFADGTPLTAADVAASINAARASEMYGGGLAHVTDVQAGDGTVTVTLSRPDSLFSWMCTLPIMKAAETGAAQPTASGRYTYGGADTLVKNASSLFWEQGAPTTIRLVDVGGHDDLVSSLSVGSIDLYSYTREETVGGSAVTSRSTTFPMNHLVFLGVNSQRTGALQMPAVRQAISAAIDRQTLCQRAFVGGATPARGALNPLYPCAVENQTLSIEGDLAGARALMEQAGYTLSASDGIWRDANGARLSLRLLVYAGSPLKRSAATQLADQLAEAGFAVTVEETADFAGEYVQKVNSGDFDLYIGEVKLYNNMDLSPFLEGGQVSGGIAQDESVAAAYAALCQSTDNAGAFEETFAGLLPWIPLCWRNGTLVTSKQITCVTPSISNVFYSLRPPVTGEAAASSAPPA